MKNTPARPTLKDLQIGDKFYPASQHGKKYTIYEVKGKSEFNARHGSATRMCLNTVTKALESKSCRQEVVKLSYCIECGMKIGQGEIYCDECKII